ncbi:hypothetical protein O9992_17560 [Vibrio lentus]|nr:hypothetical protein [Vibrio lentus]
MDCVYSSRIDVFVPNVSALSDEWEDVLQKDISAAQHAVHWFYPNCLNPDDSRLYWFENGGYTACHANAYGAGKAALAHYIEIWLTYVRR